MYVCMYVCYLCFFLPGATMKVFTRGVVTVRKSIVGFKYNNSISLAYYTNGTALRRPNPFIQIPVEHNMNNNYDNAYCYALRVRPPLNVYSVPANQIISSFSFFAVDGVTG